MTFDKKQFIEDCNAEYKQRFGKNPTNEMSFLTGVAAERLVSIVSHMILDRIVTHCEIRDPKSGKEET